MQILAVPSSPRFFRCAALWILGVAIGSFAADESAPKLLSKTGGGGWSNLFELKQAAASGNPRACTQLGEQTLRGEEVPKDIPRAIALLEAGARGGVANASFRLGMLYDDGELVRRDSARAVEYFRVAAAGGVVEAYYNLGAAYSSARGVKRDYAEALGWLILATKSGAAAEGEQKLRAYLTKNGRTDAIRAGEARALELERELTKRPTTDDRPPAPPPANAPTPPPLPPPERPALATLAQPSPGSPTMSRPEIPFAPPHLAAPTIEIPSDGPRVKLVSPTGRTLEWPTTGALRRAAEAGDPTAQSAWGQVLLKGELVPADLPLAVSMFERAAKAGSLDATLQLAGHYAKEPNKNDEKAFSYLLQAARACAASAMLSVGNYYWRGQGTKANAAEALAWLIVARKRQIDDGSESRLRAELQKTAPTQLATAETRAITLERELSLGAPR